ncbi:MAG: DUF1127 domain-containing protein [Proteobacteria bacterium]|nr:DUF1127 domain-containing protein [Pseudomonadota bacterium]
MSVQLKPQSGRSAIFAIDKSPFRTSILRWWNRAIRSWQRRKMKAALHSLDDRILQDIGLSRGEIEDFVDGLSSAELRMTPIAAEPVVMSQDISHADLRRAA